MIVSNYSEVFPSLVYTFRTKNNSYVKKNQMWYTVLTLYHTSKPKKISKLRVASI